MIYVYANFFDYDMNKSWDIDIATADHADVNSAGEIRQILALYKDSMTKYQRYCFNGFYIREIVAGKIREQELYA